MLVQKIVASAGRAELDYALAVADEVEQFILMSYAALPSVLTQS